MSFYAITVALNPNEKFPELWFCPCMEWANMCAILIVLRQRSAIEGKILLCRAAQ